MMRLLLLLLFALAAGAALAVQPDELMKDPALEARARALSAQLRCMVCQNESIDESEASLARDIRKLIRERIAGGESNDQVKEFLVSRYGDFILLKPPMKAETLLLWLSAPAALAIGALAIGFAARRPRLVSKPLTKEEEARVVELTTSD
jgi:cytochrome c-type biogenesis protein CcmH